MVALFNEWQEWVYLAEGDAEGRQIATSLKFQCDAALSELAEMVQFSHPHDEWNAGIEINHHPSNELWPRIPWAAWEKSGLKSESLFQEDRRMGLVLEGPFAFGRARHWLNNLPAIFTQQQVGKWIWSIEIFPIQKWTSIPFPKQDFRVEELGKIYSQSYQPGGVRWTHLPSDYRVTVRSSVGIGWCNKKAEEWMKAKLVWKGMIR